MSGLGEETAQQDLNYIVRENGLEEIRDILFAANQRKTAERGTLDTFVEDAAKNILAPRSTVG